MAHGGRRPSLQKKEKYQDKQRDRFCRQTTYGAEFKESSPQQAQYHKEIDNQIVSKYSNRIVKTSHAHSVDRNKHRRDQKKYKHHHSTEKQVRHRYDYDNALVSTGKAFYQPDKSTGNRMEYYYHHMGRPGRRQVVDRVVKYKYPSHVGTSYNKDYAKYNSIKAPEGRL